MLNIEGGGEESSGRTAGEGRRGSKTRGGIEEESRETETGEKPQKAGNGNITPTHGHGQSNSRPMEDNVRNNTIPGKQK